MINETSQVLLKLSKWKISICSFMHILYPLFSEQKILSIKIAFDSSRQFSNWYILFLISLTWCDKIVPIFKQINTDLIFWSPYQLLGYLWRHNSWHGLREPQRVQFTLVQFLRCRPAMPWLAWNLLLHLWPWLCSRPWKPWWMHLWRPRSSGWSMRSYAGVYYLRVDGSGDFLSSKED